MNPRKAWLILAIIGQTLAAQISVFGQETGLVAHYTFDEGCGDVLKDVSGHGLDGRIRGAVWEKTARGYGLRFKSGDFVDLGQKPELNIAGDMTLAAWVKLEAPGFPALNSNWTIFDCDRYQNCGYIFRVDGAYAKVYFRTSNKGPVTQGYSSATLENNTYYHLVVVKKGDEAVFYIDGRPDFKFTLRNPAPAEGSFSISQAAQSFEGLMDDLAFYRRALSREEILAGYREGAAVRGKDVSWFGKIRLMPFIYYDENVITVEADLMGVLPLSAGERMILELGLPGQPPLQSKEMASIPENGRDDYSFALKNLAPGQYRVRAVLRDGQGKDKTQTEIQFHYPRMAVKAPSPSEKNVPPVQPTERNVPFKLKMYAAGGFSIQCGDETFPVESEFSFPNGRFNVLAAADAGNPGCEPGWFVATAKIKGDTCLVTAEGKYYSLHRTIRRYANRINIQDAFSNRTGQAVGIIVKNRVGLKNRGVTGGYVSGRHFTGSLPAQAIKDNPTVFLKKSGLGIGLVALDDVFIVQSKADVGADGATLFSDQFALDADAVYTMEWSIYLNRTGDYYDFINEVRKDEGRNNRVEGGFAFITKGPFNRRMIPDPEFVRLRHVKYGCIHCLSGAADDPSVSIEGIEFMDFPEEMRLLKEQAGKIRKKYPDMYVMFHVAHSLYATKNPERLFPDSRVIDENGKQAVYNGEASYVATPYLSKERVKEGWRWWIYYPTLDNSFGRALMKSADVMVDEMGYNGVFMDGFMWAYGGEYTYDRWDGHTAEIDPVTQTIKRKMGSVLLLSQDALVAFCRKMRDKGAVVVANNSIITRTIGRETYIIHDREVFEGPGLHLTPNPAALSNPGVIRDEKDIHRDVYNKLRWGNLYFYYQEGTVTHPSAPARMYPITLEEIRGGFIKGKERLITSRSGVYGWLGGRDLHVAHRYDARGREVPADYLTTVDSGGVRTEVNLSDLEIAVVEKVPVRLKTKSPVNVIFRQYGPDQLGLGLNGKGKVELTLSSGEWKIKPDAVYLAKIDRPTQTANTPKGIFSRLFGPRALPHHEQILIKSGPRGTLSLAFRIDGPQELILASAGATP